MDAFCEKLPTYRRSDAFCAFCYYLLPLFPIIGAHEPYRSYPQRLTPSWLTAHTGLYCLTQVHTQPWYLDLLGSNRAQNRAYS